MTERQAPMDFFLEVEASVFQGYRDHRGAVGEPSELIRRVFLAGLPSTLRDLLVLKDDCSPIQLAKPPEAWNSGMHQAQQFKHSPPVSKRTPRERLPASTYSRPATRTRDRYDLFPVATSPHLLSLFPHLQHHGVMFGEYHRSSTTAPGNAELLPVSLHHQPTLVSVVEGAVTCLVSAPFREARKEGFPTSLATLQEGTRTRSITVQTEPSKHSSSDYPAVGGRPVVALSVDGKTLLCFIDTGSQVTLVKPSALEVLDPAKKLRHHASSKILQGVSGEPFHPAAEVTLSFNISKDLVLLHRTTVADLFTAMVPDSGLSHLWERSTVFPSPRAITNSCNQPSGTQLPEDELDITEKRNYTAPGSTGVAAAGRDRCPVSPGSIVAQGLGYTSTATTDHRFTVQDEEENPFTIASAATEPKHFTESLSLDGAIEPELEWDDFSADLPDIPEEDWDIEGALLPPSVAVATCDAVAEPDNPDTTRPDDPDVPDLDAEDSVGPSQDPDVEELMPMQIQLTLPRTLMSRMLMLMDRRRCSSRLHWWT
ncbi:hypothetical protein C7M84_014292 [Penaeus vannamei]|uniref:Uncharacterized protein n=1 Tax=Penaeus vannamei TaxID=6689 RepID=A0A3R7PDQ8_PENVA|nr:hypothetical protein C7M84_014292 [Penaeus vannamei]